MRNIVVIGSVALGALPLFMLLKPVNGVTLDLLPETEDISIGESIIIDVQISELGNGVSPSVGGFSLEVNYDPEVLTFNNLTLSDLLNISDPGFQSIDSSSPGSLLFGNVSLDFTEDLDAAQPDSFSLANIEFIGSEIGTNSPVSLNIIEIVDENFNEFDPITQNNAIVTVNSATTQVPEKGLGVMSCGILLGLFWMITKTK